MKKLVFKISLLLSLVLAVAIVSGNLLVFAADKDYPYCITQVFHGDPKTQKGLYWSTSDTVMGSDVQIVLKTDGEPDFSNPLAEFSGTTQRIVQRNKAGVDQIRNGHKVLVTGLSSGTTYYYRVGDKQRNLWSDVGEITTEPEDSSKFSALVFADTQFWTLAEAVYGTSLERDAFAQNPDAAFAINVGDMVDAGSSEADWEERDRQGKDIYMNKTYMPVTGNHESWNYAVYNHFNLLKPQSCKGEAGVYYSFDYGNVHFIVMDSNEAGWESTTRFTQAQINWFLADAAATDKPFKVLLMHHPMYAGLPSGEPWLKPYREYFPKLITQAGIDLVLTGHTHCWARTYPLKDIEGMSTQVAKEEFYETTINGHNYKATVNPDGTYYLTLAMSGPRQNSPSADAATIADLLAVSKRAGASGEIQGYVRLDIEDNKLGVTCYNNSYSTHTATVSDSFAIYKGTPPVEKAELEYAIALASSLNPEDYTPDSWAVVDSALEHAIDVYANPDAKQSEVDEAASNLLDAIETLVPIVIPGDVNNDGKISSLDALWVLQSLSGKKDLDDIQKLAADINKDGDVTALDALKILQVASGKEG